MIRWRARHERRGNPTGCICHVREGIQSPRHCGVSAHRPLDGERSLPLVAQLVSQEGGEMKKPHYAHSGVVYTPSTREARELQSEHELFDALSEGLDRKSVV